MTKVVSINNNSIRYDERFANIPLKLNYGEAVDIKGNDLTFMYNDNYSNGFGISIEDLKNFISWIEENILVEERVS